MKYSPFWRFSILALCFWRKTEACKHTEKRIRCPSSGYIPGETCPGVASWTCTAGINRCTCRDGLLLHNDGSCVKQNDCGPDPTENLRPKKVRTSNVGAMNNTSVTYEAAKKFIENDDKIVLLWVSLFLRDISKIRWMQSTFVSTTSGGVMRRIMYLYPVAYSNGAQAWFERNHTVRIVLQIGAGDQAMVRLDGVGGIPGALRDVYTVLHADADSIILGDYAEPHGFKKRLAKSVVGGLSAQPLCTFWARKEAVENVEDRISFKTCAGRKVRVFGRDKELCEKYWARPGRTG